jgi:inner membrane protein
MQRALLIKALLIGVVFLVLLIPLRMIDSTVAERAGRQQAVVEEIMSSSYGRQVFAGPVLSVPYVEEYDEAADVRGGHVERKRVQRSLYFFPVSEELNGDAGVGEKKRGLFRARVFDWKASVHGEFVLAGVTTIERTRTDSHITWGQPTVSLSLGDPRGLNGSPALQWAGKPAQFERGSALPNMSNGLHAAVPEFDLLKPQRFAYSLSLELRGAESLAIVPLAAENKIRLTSSWPHPSFGGQFLPLPESQEITQEGFRARWDISALASSAQQQMLAQFNGRELSGPGPARLEVRFIEPIDIYSMSDRALKYAFMFIGLTFACLILFELLKQLPIHPVQYLLCGLALAVFFLLLIGLSEHMPFGAAYVIAATGCIALLGYYLSGALRSTRLGFLFSAMLVALYSALYGLLISEDNALLLGSLLVFGILAVAMIATRRTDWYALTMKKPMIPEAGGESMADVAASPA